MTASVSGDAIVHVEGLVSRLGGRVVHDGIDLQVRSGEVLSLIGGSGSGKTTLLRTIIGLQRPHAGRVRVFGVDLPRAPAREQRFVRERWGVVFQGGALFSGLTVFENVALPLRELRMLDEGIVRDVVAVQLDRVGLAPEDGTKLPAQLSGGMVRRAALARALALDPDLLFLDEPTAGLDPASATAFQELMAELQRDLALTVFMVTHDLDTLSALSDRVAVLGEGRLLALGTLDDVRTVDHPFIQEYFSNERSRRASPRPWEE